MASVAALPGRERKVVLAMMVASGEKADKAQAADSRDRRAIGR